MVYGFQEGDGKGCCRNERHGDHNVELWLWHGPKSGMGSWNYHQSAQGIIGRLSHGHTAASLSPEP